MVWGPFFWGMNPGMYSLILDFWKAFHIRLVRVGGS